MAYINFKEEKSAALSQLEKRINNNREIFNEIRKHKTISKAYNPDEKYSYKEFKNHTFGLNGMKNEIDFQEISNKDILCSIFDKCNFTNIKFKDCKFIGCYFVECNFAGGGVSFDNCTFIKEESEKLPTLNQKDNFSCEFKECNIYGKFLNCALNYVIFSKCKIENTSFELSDLSSSIIINSELSMAIFIDVNLTGAKIVSTYIEDLEFRDKNISKIDEKTFVDKIDIRKGTREEYEGIYTVYENLANKFKQNTLNNNFGEYYYLCQNIQRKTLKPLPKLVSFLNYATCGYGERPLFAVYSSLVIILFFSFLYLFIGVDIDGKVVIYNFQNFNFDVFKFGNDFNECLNLSVGMFAGVGFNNAQPLPMAYMASNIEMLLGIIMMGIGIGTLTKKLVR